ncbi:MULTISPECIES: M23 family metallopeptidase [Luteimonas]|uniref:M23 family metallopeptidase n=1 Tax=Luteimonas TaxID=83614 RepID=UPI000C7B4F20|nr:MULTISPECIES: peptidoglycan DD-metalloendopeptidase family protein [Luteimonas]
MTNAAPPSPDNAHHQQVLQDNLLAATRNRAHEQAASTRLFPGRWTRRDWAHASLFATLGALVITLVPGFSHAMRDGHDTPLVTMSLALPPLTAAQRSAQVQDNWQIVTVAQGQTLGSIFEDLDLPATTMHRILEQSDAKARLTRMRPGTELAFDLAADGRLNKLRYDRSDTERVELALVGDRVEEQVIERPVERRNVVISGMVGRSLFHSARKLGLSGSSINTLTDEVFKYDIDFNTDVTQNDRFSVVVEQIWREGELIGTGPVQAAVFTAKGKPFSAFRYEQDGKAEYYNADGRPLKKSFIRMPIQYARLSSRFGNRRHPVLGTSRMHKGVDYAAPTGTPIMAAGDARVQFRGVQGGYGNTVVLDHGRGHTTLYAHMSRFGNIRQGQRVAQGTVIGYVGTTGLSTGPHLHYEFRVNGAHRNPLQHTMPEPDPLTGTALAQFRQQTGPALARIRDVEDIIYAQVPAKPDPDRQVASAPRNGANRG